jgi:hypothetical protein
MDWTNLKEVLVWLTGVGSPAVIAYALSWLVENWKGWSKLPRDVKFLAPMIASVLLSIGANQALQYQGVIAEIQPWFQITMSSILAWLASQKAYLSVLDSGYGKRFKAEG